MRMVLAVAGLEMEEGGQEPRNGAASRSWKRCGNEFYPNIHKETQPCRHLDFSSGRLMQDF